MTKQEVEEIVIDAFNDLHKDMNENLIPELAEQNRTVKAAYLNIKIMCLIMIALTIVNIFL